MTYTLHIRVIIIRYRLLESLVHNQVVVISDHLQKVVVDLESLRVLRKSGVNLHQLLLS